MQITGLVAFALGVSPSQYFFNRASFPTGQSPAGVALADMNGDGRPDLVVADESDKKVSILLGQADGGFGSKRDYQLSDWCQGIATGDFNRDGKMDVAVTTTTGVMVMLGNGDGTLGPSVFYPIRLGGFLLQVADMNHDGKLDLVLAGSGQNLKSNVAVLLGNGDGTFKPEKDAAVAGVPQGMAILDLNGDGTLDVALANWTSIAEPDGGPGFVTVILGKGDGTFGSPAYGPKTYAIAGIAAGDVTGDRIPDLVVSHVFSPTINVMKGNGDGTFQPEVPVSDDGNIGSQFIQLVDLNGDGKLDVVSTDFVNGGVAVLLGNGDGTFQTSTTYITGGVYFFTTGDVNGDGIIDIAMSADAGVTVLLGNGDGTFSPRVDLPFGTPQPNNSSGTLADFNGDGKLDIAVSTAKGIAVLLNNGDNSFQAPVSTPWMDNMALSQACTADFNHDGHMDLVVGGQRLLLGKGDGTFNAPIKFSPDFNVLGDVVGDFNGDGNPDVLVVGGFEEKTPIQLFLGNGDGTFQPVKRSWNLTSVPSMPVVADFNRDGKLDLAVAVNPNGVAVLLGDGNGNFANPVIYPTDELPSGLAVRDLNGDGIPDLIVTTTLMVDVFLGKGDGTFTPPVDYNTFGFASLVTTGDFDGDGKVDIALVTSYGLELLFGNGNGTFSTPLVFMTNSSGAPVLAGDLNGDGIDDIVETSGNGSLFLSAPFAALSPSHLNFGTVATGAPSANLQFRVTNVGVAPLHINSATVGAPFSLAAPVCPAAIPKRSSCLIGASVLATTAGTDNDLILIDSDARNGHLAVPVTVTAVDFHKTTPSIKWATPSAITYPTALGATQLDATSPVAGNFTYSPALGKVLTAGTNTLSVSFAPKDTTNYTTATATVALQVNQATPKITWAAPAAIAYGTLLSGKQLDAGSPVGGTFSYTPPAGTLLSAGSHQLSTTLTPADITDFKVETASVSVTITKATQTITFTAPASPVTYGAAAITLTASSNSGLPVTFTATGPATITNNSLAFTGAGSVVVTANQAGNGNYNAATAVSKTITVNKATTAVGLTSSAPSGAYGASVTLTAKLTNAGSGSVGPTGTVTFLSGTTAVGTATPSSSGVATLVTAALPVGTDSITASYGGDSNYAAAKSSAVTVAVSKAAQTINFIAPASPVSYGIAPITLTATASSGLAVTFTVTSGPATVSGSTLTITGAGTVVVTANQAGNSSYNAATAVQQTILVNAAVATNKLTSSSASVAYGASVTLTATLTGGAVKPTGTVTFLNGTASFGTGALNSSGVATLALATLPVGKNSITARFPGDTHYGAVTSAPLIETVNQATPTAKLTTSASTAAYGAPVTLTATLTGTGGAKPTGSVTFFNGSATLGTGTVNSSGVATLLLTSLPVGKDSITASYGGDANYTIATAAATAVTISKAAQTITFTAPASPVTYGVTPITLTATASSGLPVILTVTSGPATISGNVLTITGAGSVVVAANQAGNGNYNAATAVTKTITVNKVTPTASLKALPTTAVKGSSVTFTATITGLSGGAAPTGTVTFLEGATSLGTGTLASGVAAFSTTKLATAKHTVTAKYPGDGNYATVTSAAVTVTVTAN